MPCCREHPVDPPPEGTQRNLFAWSLLAGLILLAALAGPFFAGRVYTSDDLGAFHLPTRAFYAGQLARSEPFDWMPQLYSGFYLTGDGQAGTYHPLHFILYRCLSLRAAAGLEWLLSYPLMLAGMYLFLRRRLGRRDAAMLGSLLFTFCGFNVLHFLHPNAVAVVAHIPWLLWTIDIVLVDSSRRKVALAQLGIALLTGSQLLLGYPQYAWFSLLTEAAYAAFVLSSPAKGIVPSSLRENRDSPQPLASASSPWARLVIAKGCGLLLGGVQLLPTIDALGQSTRQSADAAIAYWNSLPPLDLVQLVAPYLLTDRVVGQNTHEAGLYLGAVPLMLIVWLLIRRDELGTLGRLARATSVFGLLALFLAFGEYGQLYRLQSYLPVVGRFRCPCRYLVLFQLATTVLAAIGFVLLVREHQRSRQQSDKHSREQRGRSEPAQTPSRWFGGLWAVVALSAVAALVGLVFQDRSWTASVPAVLAGPLLLGTAAVLVALAARGTRAALPALILFAAADLGIYGFSYAVYPNAVHLDQFITSAPTPPFVLTPPGAMGGLSALAPSGTDKLPLPSTMGGSPALAHGRVLASLAGPNNQGIRTGNEIVLAGWSRADGYAGLEPTRRLDYRRVPALRAAGVRWVRRNEATADIAGLIPRGESWMEVPRPLPRARLLGHVRQSSDPARDIAQIDVDSTALVEVPLALPQTTPGTARLLADRPGRLVVECDCPGRQLLVVSEGFHPGWQAMVDGRRRAVLRANGDFIGCLVGPGRQRVVLEFRPQSLHRGWIVSCLGLGLALVSFIGCQSPGRATPAVSSKSSTLKDNEP
ncbi:MAG: hypothetical protein A2V70_20940 [Planctomycetes bacterium RBG_13_63_9]|nr:MAG: hypothetical protein A2V70_20940 [Planctomycetes bacterium RBG_13_63_9]